MLILETTILFSSGNDENSNNKDNTIKLLTSVTMRKYDVMNHSN